MNQCERLRMKAFDSTRMYRFILHRPVYFVRVPLIFFAEIVRRVFFDLEERIPEKKLWLGDVFPAIRSGPEPE